MTDPHLVTVLVNDSVTGPHDLTVTESGNNIVTALFFPSLNIFGRGTGNHIHATTRAASPAGTISNLRHDSARFLYEDTIR